LGANRPAFYQHNAGSDLGTQVPFDKAALLSLQVQFPSGGAFIAALDDFTFY
jgi:hypothetical protein